MGRNLSRGQQGQALVLVVLLVPVLLGMVGFVLDYGRVAALRRDGQNAADAAALAAAQELPNVGQAREVAQEFAGKNGLADGQGGVAVTMVTPYEGDPEKVEVTISRPASMAFLSVLGVNEVNIIARAVAERSASAGHGPAIYAAHTDCDDPKEVEMSGATIDIIGDVISNGSVKMTGSDIEVDGRLTYMCSNPLLNNGEFTNGLNQATQPSDWPVYYEYPDFSCNYQASESSIPWEINPTDNPGLYADPSAHVLKPGVYCHNSDIEVSEGASGTVTFVSKKGVYFSGGPYDLTAYQHNVVVYAERNSTYTTCRPTRGTVCERDDAVHISSNGFTWEGIILATRGSCQFSAASVETSSGGVYCDAVKFSSSSGSITAPSDTNPTPGHTRLVE